MTQQVSLIARMIVLGLLLSAPVSAQTPISVYIFTAHDASGLVDKPTEERLKCVADMRTRLAKFRQVQLVDSPENAKISVEIVRVGEEDSSSQTVAVTNVVGKGTAITNPSHAVPTWIAHARITSGTYQSELESSIGPFMRTYGENMGRKLEDWIQKNMAALRK